MFSRGMFSAKWFGIIGIVVVLSILLIGCAPKATPTPTPRPTPTPIKGEGKLVAFLQGAYEKGYQDSRWMPRFEQETGCKVTIFGGISSAMLSRVQAEKGNPSVDIVNMDYGPFTQAKDLGLVDKINRDLIPNLKYLSAKLQEPDDMAVYYRILVTVLAINSGELEKRGIAKPTSWLDLGNPAYKGKVVLTDMTVGQTPEMIALAARGLGGSESNPDAAFKWLEEQVKPNIMAVVTLADFEKLLGEGSAWLGFGTQLRPMRLAVQGMPVEIVYPKEGFTVTPHTLEIVKGAANPVCANLFFNFMLDKRVQEELVPEFYMALPVRTDVTVPEKYKGLGPDPKLFDQAVEIDWSKIDRAAWTDKWNRIFAK
ncbi:MAG: extracellular solute-binding protein [Chloroflexi bacterium]|nr:extracellular solute-binding protein [Chloroflexota bacterium]